MSSSPQPILDAINELNGSSLTLSQIEFSEPQWNIDGPDDFTTQVLITSIDTSTVVGEQTIYYNKMDLYPLSSNSLDISHYLPVDHTVYINEQWMLDKINAVYGTSITNDDFSAHSTFESIANPHPLHYGPIELFLSAQDESYCFTGTARLRIRRTIDIDLLLPNQQLNAIEWPSLYDLSYLQSNIGNLNAIYNPPAE